MNIYRNPFVVALWTPIYLLAGAVAITNDFLMAAIYIMFTLGIIGAYVTDFPMLPGLYQNEVAHKTAIASLLGVLMGLILFLIFVEAKTGEGSPPSTQGQFLLTWAVMAIPAYPLKVFLISRLNKRDLEAEQAVRKEKKKQRKSGGPPIMNKDHF